MKHVVSVSIGSSRRDHRVELELLGERDCIERRGTDGDLRRAAQLIRELDGKVDAIGLGGMDLYIFAGGRRYVLRDAKKLARVAQKTPVVDGSGLKNSLERWVVRHLCETKQVVLSGRRVLMVAAVDRFGMAEELVASGADVTFGDLIFTLGVPIPLHSLTTIDWLARFLAPVITKLPFKMLYPTGEKQHESVPRYERFFREVEIIAGDFHFIRRYMPQQLDGKGIITNTVTESDVELLRSRGVSFLVTTTPNLGGRSFGTNVIEAVLVAISGRSPETLTPGDYLNLLKELQFLPRIERFQATEPLRDLPAQQSSWVPQRS